MSGEVWVGVSETDGALNIYLVSSICAKRNMGSHDCGYM